MQLKSLVASTLGAVFLLGTLLVATPQAHAEDGKALRRTVHALAAQGTTAS